MSGFSLLEKRECMSDVIYLLRHSGSHLLNSVIVFTDLLSHAILRHDAHAPLTHRHQPADHSCHHDCHNAGEQQIESRCSQSFTPSARERVSQIDHLFARMQRLNT